MNEVQGGYVDDGCSLEALYTEKAYVPVAVLASEIGSPCRAK